MGSEILSGLLIFGRHGRLERTVLGDITDTATDYDAGERSVLALVQFFDALGRPKAFEAAVEGVYAVYEKAKISRIADLYPNLTGAALKWKNATAMKQVGADAAVLQQKIQAAMPDKAAAVPDEIKNPVYDPNSAEDKLKTLMAWSMPTWGWIVIGVGAVIAAGVVAGPAIASAVGSYRLAKAAAR